MGEKGEARVVGGVDRHSVGSRGKTSSSGRFPKKGGFSND